MGPSVRRLYEQGKSVNGAGINASFAIHQVRMRMCARASLLCASSFWEHAAHLLQAGLRYLKAAAVCFLF